VAGCWWGSVQIRRKVWRSHSHYHVQIRTCFRNQIMTYRSKLVPDSVFVSCIVSWSSRRSGLLSKDLWSIQLGTCWSFSVNSIACLLLGYYFIVDSIRCLVLGLAVLGKYKVLQRVLVSRRFASSCIYRCWNGLQVWCLLLSDKVPFRMHWPAYCHLHINGMFLLPACLVAQSFCSYNCPNLWKLSDVVSLYIGKSPVVPKGVNLERNDH
jgi:hypothetical protein